MNESHRTTFDMNFKQAELFIAPKLEQDVHDFYIALKRATLVDGDLRKTWRRSFLEYCQDWHYLLFSHREFKFGFWVTQFSNAYYACVAEQEEFQIWPENEKQWADLVSKILYKLEKLFKSIGFQEMLNKCNTAYEKKIQKLMDQYSDMNRLSVDAPDLKFYLTMHPHPTAQELSHIQNFSRALKQFERRLMDKPWCRAQVLYRFYQIYRDPEFQHYVVRYYLTFQKAFYSEETNYCAKLREIWSDVTEGIGVLLEQKQFKPDVQGNLTVPPFMNDDMESPLENLESLDVRMTSLKEHATNLYVWDRGMESFSGQIIQHK